MQNTTHTDNAGQPGSPETNIAKINTREAKALAIYRQLVVPAGDWTSGTGNYVRKLAIPLHCVELPAREAAELPGVRGAAVRRLLRARPRVRLVIVPDNMRTLGKLAKREEAIAAAENAAKLAEREERMAAAKRRLAEIGGDKDDAVAVWRAGGCKHPVAGRVLAAKQASGLSWREFQLA